MTEEKGKRAILRDQVVDLVKKFITEEGGITLADVGMLFGAPDPFGQNVASALCSQVVKFE